MFHRNFTLIRPLRLILLTCWSVVALGLPATAATAPELLEKAIYTEETVGDLDEAIKIYRKIIKDSKKTRRLGAQAQYRLGQCLVKQGKKDEAKKAFEAVVKNFPNQKKFVAKAKKHLPGDVKLLAAPWKDGERLSMKMMMGAGETIGIWGLAVDADTVDDKKVWRMLVRRYIRGGFNQGVSHSIVSQETNRPLRTSFDHTLLGRTNVVYHADRMVIKQNLLGKDETTKTIEFDSLPYSNDQTFYALRQMPLAVGYEAKWPIRVGFTGGNLVEAGISVPKKEMVETEAGKFECFKVVLNLVGTEQIVWIADTPARYPVKFEGGGVTGELVSIDFGKSRKYENTDMGFSLTVPGDWFLLESPSENEKTKTSVYLIPPTTMGESTLAVMKNSRLDKDERKSAQAWVESEIKEGKDRYKDWKLRPESWQESQIAGVKGISAIVDFTSMKMPIVGYWTMSIGEKKAIEFALQTSPEGFTALRKQHEAILKSISVKQ